MELEEKELNLAWKNTRKDIYILHWTFQYVSLEYCGHWSKFMRDTKKVLLYILVRNICMVSDYMT
jgi:hypothetical protein